MRTLLFLLTAMAVIGSGFWAYHENYATQAEQDRAQNLRNDIGAARERLAILRAEWAYLNRPDRLRDLAELNFDRLGLLPLRPDQFGRVDQVAFPMPEQIDISQPIDVTSAGADE
ncbi:cell division protein FtsL [Tropicibacter oceani]|uniref:Cell division protein FtsL n=1 Tax=Tropicibacter oceani TaxID=3058420 RepID=A0ABY8QFZ8_9RHOB|nr:cell division protein FtsL [Tropicibacter oceani]WGW03358.1 cell division protein FtsL [Tropicibacter oceani]